MFEHRARRGADRQICMHANAGRRTTGPVTKRAWLMLLGLMVAAVVLGMAVASTVGSVPGVLVRCATET